MLYLSFHKLSFHHSIRGRLSIAFSLVALALAVAAGGLTFYDTYRATRELQDDLLRQTAAYADPASHAVATENEKDTHIFVQTATTPSSDKHYLPLPEKMENGFYTLRHRGEDYRVFVKNGIQGRVAVLQENEYRHDLALRSAWSSALPLLLLIPLMIALLIVILQRALRPIQQLSRNVEQRQDYDLTPLDTAAVPSEIQGFVHAINRLLLRTDNLVQQQQRFIADAAHELRSPMTALSILAERLAAQKLEEPANSQLNSLLQSIRRNRQLLEQLLSLARAQSTETRQQIDSVSMAKLFQRLIEDLMPLIEQKNHDVGVLQADVPPFSAVATEIYSMVKILLDNAMLYTPPGGQIDLSARLEGNWLVLAVEDNGPGIPAVERQRVQDPFYRILGSGEVGTGLGLSIAAALAQRYHGHLTLSDSPNFTHGLLAKIYLPCAEFHSTEKNNRYFFLF